MSGFQDVVFAWQGQEYTLPATRVLPLVARMENDADLVGPDRTLIEVILGSRHPAAVALAFEHLLRAVQAPFAPGEVYLAIIAEMAGGKAGAARRVQEAVLQLLAVIAPPLHHRLTAGELTGGEAPGKKPVAG